MRSFRVGFLLLMLLAAQLPIVQASAVDDFIAGYTEPDDAVAKEDIAIERGNFVLVTVDGDETFLVDKETISFVRDEGVIRDILADHLYACLEYDSRISAVSSLLDDYNESRYPEEDTCRQYTGTSTYECVDRETCIVACLSVPLCSGIYGVEHFIDCMLNWTTETRRIDENMRGFRENIHRVREGGEAVDDEIERLEEIREASLRNKENLLLLDLYDGGFDFCPKINYSIEAIDGAIDKLEELKDDLDALDEIQGRAKGIKEGTDSRISYMETREERYASLKEKVLRTKNELAREANGLLLLVNSTDVEGKLSSLIGISDEIIVLGVSGCYRTAFSKEGDFLTASSSLNSTTATISKRYNLLLDAKKRCRQKIADATEILGANDTELNESLMALKEGYDNITIALLSPIQPNEITTFMEELNGISNSVNEIIVEKMLSQKEGEGEERKEVGIENVTEVVEEKVAETVGVEPEKVMEMIEEKGKECLGTLGLMAVVFLFAFLKN